MSREAISFQDQVAVVTGAGNGLGRSHALLLAARGAKVVVNDFGGDLTGSGMSDGPANRVVNEITTAGGAAIADHHGVHTPHGGQAIIETALHHYGRIDILVCNAGILINEPFTQLTDKTWGDTIAVHLNGTMRTARAAWGEMKRSGYGRMVFTASGGIFGKHGLTAYSAAKAGIYGLMRSLAQEVDGADIGINTLLPSAQTRMVSAETQSLWNTRPGQGDPAQVSGLVAYLASRDCRESGKAYTAAGGLIARNEFVQSRGVRFDCGQPITPEEIAGQWQAINNMSNPLLFENAMSSGAYAYGLGQYAVENC